MAQRRLTAEQKCFIVVRLAVFASPAEVKVAFKEQYGWAPGNQSLASYDPDTATGRRDLSDELTQLFLDTRARFRADIDSIPIANKAFRLAALDRMARKAESTGEYALAIAIHEQAAKELGDAFTNMRRMGGPNGEMLPTSGVILVIPSNGRDLPRAELDRIEVPDESLAIAAESPLASRARTRVKLLSPTRQRSATAPAEATIASPCATATDDDLPVERFRPLQSSPGPDAVGRVPRFARAR